MNKLLIIGLGRLGTRYLEGLKKYDDHINIYGLDSSVVSLKRAEKRWQDVFGRASKHKIHLIQNFSELPKKIDLAIVATTADVRLQVMQDTEIYFI